MKVFSVIMFFLITGYAFCATTLDVLHCQVTQPANVANPYVDVIYSKDFSDSVLNDESYGATLKSQGFNTALYAARYTNADGSQYDAYVGLTGLEYNEDSHLMNAQAQYVFPVDANTSYDVVFAPQNADAAGDFIALFVFNSSDPVDAPAIAVLQCIQGQQVVE